MAKSEETRKDWLAKRNNEKKMELARQMYEDRLNDMSFRDIAQKHGKSVGTVHKYLKDFQPSFLEAPAMMWREHEIEKLDDLETRVWQKLDKKYYKVDHGKLIRMDDETGEEQPMLDDGPFFQAVTTLLKLSERRSKLLGLDKPSEVEVTHKTEVQDSELLEVLKRAQQRAQQEDIVDAEVVDAPALEEGDSDEVV